MTEDRGPAFTALLDEALRLPVEARTAFIDQACAGDSALRAALALELSSGGETLVFSDRPASPEALDGQVASGTRLGPWEIIHRIGQGGMGEVYLARRADGAFELEVAIKLLKRGLDTVAVVQRFLAERRILAQLTHPNIAHAMDAGATPDGRPYLVMEYVLSLIHI
jgi:serine/threonine protein kinase